MKILVTGANGFLGSFLCNELVIRGTEVKLVVRSLISSTENSMLFFKEIDGDTEWEDSFKDIEVVIHLAARVHVTNDKVENPIAEFAKTNIEGTLNLAEQAVKAGVKRFIFLSSVHVNGVETRLPFNENQIPNPSEPYAISKYEAEIGLRQLAKTSGLEVVIIRPPLVYGKNPKGNFKRLIDLCQLNLPLPFGAIHNKRSLIYIENLVDFIIHCIDHAKAADETFLIADGEDVSTTDLIREIHAAGGSKPLLIPVPQKLIVWGLRLLGKKALATRLCGNLQIDITKAKTLLGWKPPYTFKEGIARTMQDQVK